MKIKTSELTGATLDWAVAKIEGWPVMLRQTPKRLLLANGDDWELLCEPSADWSQGGPIIEREGIAIHPSPTWTARYGLPVLAHHGGFRGHFQHIGPTPLIAAMRCFVASKLGDEVDVPEELL